MAKFGLFIIFQGSLKNSSLLTTLFINSPCILKFLLLLFLLIVSQQFDNSNFNVGGGGAFSMTIVFIL
jgi:hypothetical protein